MSDTPPTNAPELSVSELSGALKRTVEDAFGHVRVRGEISGYRGPHSSGHAYFGLKDENAKIDAVVWRGVMSRLKVKPEEGMEVIATGKVTTYPGRSSYQIVIEEMEPAGAGALMALLDARRRALMAEGLFDAARKKPLPYLPRVIGVVTSPTGAVIRDILHRLADRFPRHVLVWPVRVQGETSAAEIAAAISGFNALKVDGTPPRPDLLIVARGGGSLEDLWSFNEEIVVRAVAESAIPVISAVGHETDTTLIDFAADVRAPTPTGAAEMAVPVRRDLQAHLAQLDARLAGSMRRLQDRRARELAGLSRALPRPDMLLATPRQRFDLASQRLAPALSARVARARLRLSTADARLSVPALGALVARRRETLVARGRALDRAAMVITTRARGRLDATVRGLSPLPLSRRVSEVRRRLDESASRSLAALQRRLTRAREGLEARAKLLEAFSYRGVLERGFALVLDDQGKPVRRVADTAPGMAVTLAFADGEAGATVNGSEAPRKTGAKPQAAKPQPDLFS